MKVYILIPYDEDWSPFAEGVIMAVYSNQEAAEAAVKAWEKEENAIEYGWRCLIEEWNIQD